MRLLPKGVFRSHHAQPKCKHHPHEYRNRLDPKCAKPEPENWTYVVCCKCGKELQNFRYGSW